MSSRICEVVNFLLCRNFELLIFFTIASILLLLAYVESSSRLVVYHNHNMQSTVLVDQYCIYLLFNTLPSVAFTGGSPSDENFFGTFFKSALKATGRDTYVLQTRFLSLSSPSLAVKVQVLIMNSDLP